MLNLILSSNKEESEIRKQAFPFVPERYIRTFDVIPDVNWVFYEEAEVGKKLHHIRTLTLYPK